MSETKYLPPSFSRLSEPLRTDVVNLLYKAFHREPPFEDVPLSVYDRGVMAVPPPAGMTSDDFRRLAFEDLNGLAQEASSDERNLRHTCLRLAEQHMLLNASAIIPVAGIAPTTQAQPVRRLTKAMAQRAIERLLDTHDLPDDTTVRLDGEAYLSVPRNVGGLDLRFEVWSRYSAKPIIDSRLAFRSNYAAVALVLPERIFMDRYAGIAASRDEFEPRLRRIVQYGCRIQAAIVTQWRMRLH